MDINSFGYDTEAYEEGLWVGDIPGFGDIRLKVRGQLSDHSMATRARLSREASKDLRDAEGQLTEAGAIEINSRVIAASGLVDWQNIDDGAEPVEFNDENVKMLLANKRFRIGAVAYAMAKVEALISKEALPKN